MAIAKEYNRNFFKVWSADMAYILGFMYADGNIVETKRGNQYVALYTADRALLVRIRSRLGSEHKLSKRNTVSGSVYRIQVGSKEWFADLGVLGLHPNKTKRMQIPNIPCDFFGDFVRGYFDGDGNVWSGYINTKRKTPTHTIQVFFTSCSKTFLVALRNRLHSNGLLGGGLYVPKHDRFSRLIFSSNDALKIYKIMYNGRHKLFLKRKKAVFERFIKLRS